jgi:hypothetical protein
MIPYTLKTKLNADRTFGNFVDFFAASRWWNSIAF